MLLVDVNKLKTQLAQFSKGFEKFESVFRPTYLWVYET